jgi:hypothetical protein
LFCNAKRKRVSKTTISGGGSGEIRNNKHGILHEENKLAFCVNLRGKERGWHHQGVH